MHYSADTFTHSVQDFFFDKTGPTVPEATGTKGFVQWPNNKDTLPTKGFKLATFWSQAWYPNPKTSDHVY